MRLELLVRGRHSQRRLERRLRDLSDGRDVAAPGDHAGANLIARVGVVQRAHHAVAEQHVVDARQGQGVIAVQHGRRDYLGVEALVLKRSLHLANKLDAVVGRFVEFVGQLVHRVLLVPRLQAPDVELDDGGARAAERGGLLEAVHLRHVAANALSLQRPNRLDARPGSGDLEQVLLAVDVDLVEHRAHVPRLGDDLIGVERGDLVLDDLDGDQAADALSHHAAEVDERLVDDALEPGVLGAGEVHATRLVHLRARGFVARVSRGMPRDYEGCGAGRENINFG